jgi:tRNA threonylcarbamoyladenosine biosynthesis protein TsaE
MTYEVYSTEETEEVGRGLAQSLVKSDKQRAFIALYGEMGVGKTAFVRGFCSYLGINSVKSPTYTVVNEYRGARNVFHFDLYRIDGADDLVSVGYDDYLMRDGFVLTEWSERIPEEIPSDAVRVTLSRSENSENERRIEIENL